MISKQKNEKENYIDVSNSTSNLHSIKPKTSKNIENSKLPFSSINLMISKPLTKQPSLVRGLSNRNLNFIEKPVKRDNFKTEVSPTKLKITKNSQTFLNQVPKLHEKKISQKDIKLHVNKEDIPIQPPEDERIIKSFCTDIVLYFKDEKYHQNFLTNHTIQPALRAKMIDWMVEVLSSYKCQDQTFFISVSIMDQFLTESKRSLCPQDIHLIGVACMFMASKYEEIYPIKLEVVYEKIGHKKLPKEQIKAQECEIMFKINLKFYRNCLNFNFTKITLYETITLYLTKISLVFKLDKNQKEYLMKCCVMISRMILYDYEYFSKLQDGLNMAHLAGAILLVGIKYTAQQQILCESDIILEKEKLMDHKSKVVRHTQNFDINYPGLDNIKKFYNFTLPVYKDLE